MNDMEIKKYNGELTADVIAYLEKNPIEVLNLEDIIELVLRIYKDYLPMLDLKLKKTSHGIYLILTIYSLIDSNRVLNQTETRLFKWLEKHEISLRNLVIVQDWI